jgi:hypothetical protein
MAEHETDELDPVGPATDGERTQVSNAELSPPRHGEQSFALLEQQRAPLFVVAPRRRADAKEA